MLLGKSTVRRFRIWVILPIRTNHAKHDTWKTSKNNIYYIQWLWRNDKRSVSDIHLPYIFPMRWGAKELLGVSQPSNRFITSFITSLITSHCSMHASLPPSVHPSIDPCIQRSIPKTHRGSLTRRKAARTAAVFPSDVDQTGTRTQRQRGGS